MNLVSEFSNHQLIESLKALVAREQKCSHEIVLHLAEVDRRKLFADLGFSSLFDYCTRGLGYSNASAQRRIVASRAVKAVPEVYDCLAQGKVSLRVIDVASAAIAKSGGKELLFDLCGKGSEEAEKIIGVKFPEARKRLSDRVVPVVLKEERAELPLFNTEGNSNYFRAEVNSKPVEESGIKFRMTMTVGSEFSKKLERVKGLLNSTFDETGAVLERVLDEFIKRNAPEERIKRRKGREEKEKDRGAKVEAAGRGTAAADPLSLESCSVERETEPRTVTAQANRRYPTSVLRDQVFERDGFQCSFVGPDGNRCGCRVGLEIDHIRPWAYGGKTEISNLRTLCRTHNLMFARRVFGRGKIEQVWGSRKII